MTVPSNSPKSKMEIETEAIVRATTANAALANAKKEAEDAEKEVRGLHPLGNNAHVPQVNSVDGERPFPGITSGQSSDPSCDSCTTMLAIVSAIVAASIFLLLVWLFYGKASNEQIGAVQKTATEASATAKTAAKNAEEAKAGIAEVAGLKSQLAALKKEMATVAANDDAANAKADALTSKVDNAVSAMKKVQIAASSTHTHPSPKKHQNNPMITETPQVSSQLGKTPEKVVSPSKAWGFVQNDATATTPKPCYTSKLVSGSTPRCSSFEVVTPKQEESESDWTARIARDYVKMKGFETKHLGKM